MEILHLASKARSKIVREAPSTLGTMHVGVPMSTFVSDEHLRDE